ncbi:hypothetical protein XA68_13549 [Ophiocordyceps unilateralis]|uniref:Uncharacterized protein n=1 Tax=Ophiocordyceps unilateralis TaxID=268505 RepID=A0A2A9PB71_OPHUN|nr:hypothetical protein XA68_13549 [Ophiocordyceps unilateralis]
MSASKTRPHGWRQNGFQARLCNSSTRLACQPNPANQCRSAAASATPAENGTRHGRLAVRVLVASNPDVASFSTPLRYPAPLSLFTACFEAVASFRTAHTPASPTSSLKHGVPFGIEMHLRRREAVFRVIGVIKVITQRNVGLVHVHVHDAKIVKLLISQDDSQYGDGSKGKESKSSEEHYNRPSA